MATYWSLTARHTTLPFLASVLGILFILLLSCICCSQIDGRFGGEERGFGRLLLVGKFTSIEIGYVRTSTAPAMPME